MRRPRRSKAVQAEWDRCEADFDYFRTRYLRISDRETGRTIPFKAFRHAQQATLDGMARARESGLYSTLVLKARKEGVSTAVAAYFFWKLYFTDGFWVRVASESSDGAGTLFQIYERYYDCLPPWMQGMRTIKKRTTAILLFSHGGGIQAASANSSTWRGDTTFGLHFSEFAHYDDITSTMAAAAQTGGGACEIIAETTANGLNAAYDMWFENPLYEKVFFSFMDDPGYVSDRDPGIIHEAIQEIADTFGLSKEQAAWANITFHTKCNSDINVFNQEYPAAPTLAFISSGTRYFPLHYPDARITSGIRPYAEPEKFRPYVAGVDTASGSTDQDASYSAMMVMDVSDWKQGRRKVRDVASVYVRQNPNEFAHTVYEQLVLWGEPLAVVERNANGIVVLEYLVEKQYPNIYAPVNTVVIDPNDPQFLGFWTDRQTRPSLLAMAHRYLSKKWWVPTDERFKAEVNTFVYNDKGEPQPQRRKNSDMIMAACLAIEGAEQSWDIRTDKLLQRPEGIHETIKWQAVHGINPNQVPDEMWADPPDIFELAAREEDAA